MPTSAIAPTGIAGLDEILGGGLPRDRIYLLQGESGSGKTTVGLQFLLEGAAAGERTLFVSLTESRSELAAVATSHGWSLDAIGILEVPVAEDLAREEDNTLFVPAEVELGETTRAILRNIEESKASRVVVDSLSEIRLLSQSELRYRRQVLALKQFFSGRRVTAILIDDARFDQGDIHLESVAHGVIRLEQITPEYGAERRRLIVSKLRGVKYRGGLHDMRINTGGVDVYPRLIPSEHAIPFEMKPVASGIAELDRLAGGGVESGTTALIMGPAGTGKSAIAAQFAAASAGRGERVVMFLLEEGVATLFARTRALGIPLEEQVASGAVRLEVVNPSETAPGEFTHSVREAVQTEGAKMIVIDSLNGFFNALPQERTLSLHLNQILAFLRLQGVTSILTLAQQGFVGVMTSPVDVSYLADTVFLLRFFEANGRIRKAVSVPKKRSGPHEPTIRELALNGRGLHLGEPLVDFSGVLSGTPIFTKEGGGGLFGDDA